MSIIGAPPRIANMRDVRTYMEPWKEFTYPAWNIEEESPNLYLFFEIHKGRMTTPCIYADWAGGLLKLELQLFFMRIGIYWCYDRVAWDYVKMVSDEATINSFQWECTNPECDHDEEPEE